MKALFVLLLFLSCKNSRKYDYLYKDWLITKIDSSEKPDNILIENIGSRINYKVSFKQDSLMIVDGDGISDTSTFFIKNDTLHIKGKLGYNGLKGPLVKMTDSLVVMKLLGIKYFLEAQR